MTCGSFEAGSRGVRLNPSLSSADSRNLKIEGVLGGEGKRGRVKGEKKSLENPTHQRKGNESIVSSLRTKKAFEKVVLFTSELLFGV